MKMNNIFKVVVLSVSLGLVSGAQAATYTYQITNPHGGDEAGDITQFSTSYNSDTQALSWQSTLTETNGVIANSFWLVLSDGPDPMIDRNEYAILYGDSYSGNVAAYVYNGLNSGSSWNTPGEFIHNYGGVFETTETNVGERTFSFSIDASILNSYLPTTPGTNDWDGVQFDETIGVWYHPAYIDKPASFNADGSLLEFPEIVSGFFDLSEQYTVASVPEPSSLVLVGVGLIGLFARRQSKKYN